MAINFPNSPSVGQIYSFGGYNWQWNGSYWESYSTEVGYLSLSGGTVSGETVFTNGLTANTISATTYNNLPISGLTEGNYIGITNSNGNFTISFTGTTGSNFTGGTVAGATNFTGGLSANTFSAATYENLPITGVTSGTGISVTSTGGGGYQITNTNPDQTVVITGGTNIEIVSAYPNFGVNFTGNTSAIGDYLPLSGGTVTGGTVFTSGVTANTISNLTYLRFNLTATTTHTEGQIHWNDDTKTLEVDTDKTGVTYETGQNSLVRVTNKTGAPLIAGTVVYINGAQAGRPTVTKATYEQDATSARSLGFITATINNNNQGYVTTNGLLRNVNTNSYTAGTQLYLYTGGTVTNVRPIAPKHEVRLGYVVTQDLTAGVIYVYVQNGYEFSELHDVQISGQTNNDIPYWNGSLGVWKNTNSPIFTSLTSTTISASTYNNLPGSSSSNCLTTFYVTNISGCSPVNILSPLNVTSGINVTGTTNFTNSVDFSGGLTASTVSATTYQNLPVSAVTNGSGISTSTSNGVVTVTNSQVQGITGKTDGTGISSSISNNVLTITNTDLGSSQNIFKNIQINGVTQFAANSNSSNLNFSGINVTITSAATNTLVFSAGTGGGGGGSGTVTSVTLAAGTTGSDVNISNPTITTSGTITFNIPDASATARGLVTTGTQTFEGVKTLTSPSLLGTPTAPTAALGTNTTQIASTQYVKTEIFDTAIPQVSVFGDGGDGALILTSAATLTDDRFYTNLTISGSGAINTAGYRIFVNGTLNLTSAGANAISNNGGNALNSGFSANNSGQGGLGRTISGFYATTNLLSNSVVNGGIGGAGGTSAGANGSVGNTPTALGTSYLTCGGPAGSGGAGSAGNAVSGGAGGSGQAANTNTPANFYYRTLHLGASNLNSMLIKYIYQTNNTQTLTAIPTVGGRHGGGGGGGGGGISVGPAGGSGGGGGGLVVLFAKTVLVGASTNAAAISARGGNGGNGGNGGSQSGAGGGGGGGGGGYVYLVAGSISASATFISTGGGTGGVGGNGDTGKQGGTGGTGGGGGRITVINFSANTISQTDGTTTTGSAGSAGTTPTGGAGGAGASTTYTS